MEETVFACRPEELSCLSGNLFSAIEPPCDYDKGPDLTICGTTHSGSYGRLVVRSDCCLFYGSQKDLSAVRNGVCPERRCEHG